MSDLQWRHSSSLQQWELVADGRVAATITDEYLASVAADDWEDRNVPETVYPWPGAPAEPVMITRFLPGLQSKIKQKFGLRLPAEARNLEDEHGLRGRPSGAHRRHASSLLCVRVDWPRPGCPVPWLHTSR